MSQLSQFVYSGGSGGTEPKGSITTQFPYSADALVEYNNNYYIKTGTRITGLTNTERDNILAVTDDFMLPVSNTTMGADQLGSSTIAHSFAYGNGVYIRSTVNGIIRSTDGVSWQPVEITNIYQLNGDADQLNPVTNIVFGAGIFMIGLDIYSPGAKYNATATIATSTDGLTWTVSPLTFALTGELQNTNQTALFLNLEYTDSKFWLGAYTYNAGGNWYYTSVNSTDGKNWRQFSPAQYGSGTYSVTKWITGGGYIVVAPMLGVSGTSNKYVLYGTTSSLSGSGSSGFPTDFLTQCKYLNGSFISLRWGTSNGTSASTSALSTSTTGASWTVSTVPTATILYDITYGNSLYVAVGMSGHIFTSSDAITWTLQTSGTSEQLVSIEWDSTLSLFICVGVTTIRTSSDATTWSAATIPSGLGTRSSNIPIAGSGKVLEKLNGTWFTTIGSADHIIKSTNGTTWTLSFIGGSLSTSSNVIAGSTLNPSNNALFKLESTLIACPAAGGLMLASTSTNTWTVAADTATGIFNAVAYGAGLYVAVGNGGIVYTSPDGITWTSRTSGTVTNLTGIAWSGAEFIAISSTVAIRSTDGMSWSSAGTNGGVRMCYSGGVFIVFNGSTIIRVSTTGEEWINNTIATADSMMCTSTGAMVYGSTNSMGYIITSSGIKTIGINAAYVIATVAEITDIIYFTVYDRFYYVTAPLYNQTIGGLNTYNTEPNAPAGTTPYSSTFKSSPYVPTGVKIGSNTYIIPLNTANYVAPTYGFGVFGYELCTLLANAYVVFYEGVNIWAASKYGLGWAPKSMPSSFSKQISPYASLTGATVTTAVTLPISSYVKIS